MEKTSQEILEVVVRAADDKLAQDPVVLDLRGLTPVTDYFAIFSVKNERQVQAIVDGIEEALDKSACPIRQIEGKDGLKWILVDAYDVVAHVFLYSERDQYNLEKLWSDAPLVNLGEWITE
ncbi:ribosome-associated protein IOJAP [Aerococcus urinaehominis]|uniref:Ribosomal silencing factor RsfS n=1 Tax=Aerococcus urinaehominis TaxID=128944 RepID=A0A0X8FM81_9LACT|nr:ribosome silencing factor [Aerococcus urinaehominis]AMB99649.1 ribosome-associated protein IOJAP [Aerococcus urinaehominis]SDL88912.1 ribosome-associated protein [Aerococcus urinaehominis]